MYTLMQSCAERTRVVSLSPPLSHFLNAGTDQPGKNKGQLAGYNLLSPLIRLYVVVVRC